MALPSWAVVNPYDRAISWPASKKWSAASFDVGFKTLSMYGIAANSSKTPLGSLPFSLLIIPPSGFLVSEVIIKSSNALEFTTAKWPEICTIIIGNSVDTWSKSCFVGNLFSSKTESSNPIPKIQPVKALFAGVFHFFKISISDGISFAPASGGGNICAPMAWAEKEAKCAWPSMKPGRSVFPFKSILLKLFPTIFMASSLEPTNCIILSLTIRASTYSGELPRMVRISPFKYSFVSELFLEYSFVQLIKLTSKNRSRWFFFMFRV